MEIENQIEPCAKKTKIEEIVENKDSVDNSAIDEPSANIPAQTAALDPLAYTKTGEFTSEVFKIIIDNLPKYASPTEVRKFLSKKLDLDPVKVKRPMKKTWAYVTFRNEESRQKALGVLNEAKFKSTKLVASIAKPSANPFARNEARGDKKIEDNRSVREKTAPLHMMEYQDQLKLKLEEIQSVLDNYKLMLKKSWPTKFPETDYDFKISSIKPSTAINGYRNKCEFTVGRNVETQDPCAVGFVKGRFNHGNISVEDPGECTDTCPQVMLDEVRDFKKLISNSAFPPYDAVTNTGAWKALELRTNKAGSMMVMPVVDMRQLTEEGLQSLSSLLMEHYSVRSELSLFLKLVGKGETIKHLSGPEFMTEKLCGLEFQITSGSFFQVNTDGADILYQTIKDTAKLDQDTILLDVCCGTGTIGIILSRFVRHVYGIEIVKSAVEDARRNAARNGVENITFVEGNAKTETMKILRKIPKDTRIVAIVDPPRNGLHGDVVSSIRGNEMITELIYVSCDIKQVVNNMVSICCPTSMKYGGDPFRFVSAVAVDMFPHTRKFEVIFHFQRGDVQNTEVMIEKTPELPVPAVAVNENENDDTSNTS